MSTNYYFKNKEQYEMSITAKRITDNKIEEIINLIKNIVNDENEILKIKWKLEDATYIGYERIHIGKRSMGWMPSFERQKGLFGTVREMKKFYEDNKDIYEIENEYGVVLSWDELEKELMEWKGDRENIHDSYKDEDGYIWHRYEFS
jgi:hypothetical protein